MKKFLMAAVALTAMSATPAMAAGTPVSQDYSVTGTVGGQCGGLTAGTVGFGNITTGTDGKVTTGSSTSSATNSGVFCNAAGSTISFSATAMKSDTTHAAATGYTDTLTFDPVVKVNSATVTSGSAFTSGSLDISATNLSSNGAIPFADTYTGKITVTLTPGV